MGQNTSHRDEEKQEDMRPPRASGATGRGPRAGLSFEAENGDTGVEVARSARDPSTETRPRRRGRGLGLPLQRNINEPPKEEEVEQESHQSSRGSHEDHDLHAIESPLNDTTKDTSPCQEDAPQDNGMEGYDEIDDEIVEDQDEDMEEEDPELPPEAASAGSRTPSTLVARMPSEDGSSNKKVIVRVFVNKEQINGAPMALDTITSARRGRGLPLRTMRSSPTQSSSSEVPADGGTVTSRNGRHMSTTKSEPGTPTAVRSAGLGHDGNLFYCHVCKDFGDVVCCDGCPRVYHPTCIPLEDPSRQALDNDDDPWYCPDCLSEKKQRGADDTSPSATRAQRRLGGREHRAVRRKCSECQQSGGTIPMEPCEGCGVYLHHPSCPGKRDRVQAALDYSAPLCSNCRAEAVVEEEKNELEGRRKRRKVTAVAESIVSQLDHEVGSDDHSENEEVSAGTASVEGRSGGRARSRSIDTFSSPEEGDADKEEDEDSSSDSFHIGKKRKRRAPPSLVKRRRGRPPIVHTLLSAPGDAPVKKKRGRPPLSLAEKQLRAKMRASSKKRKKKKKRRSLSMDSKSSYPRSSPRNDDVMPPSPRNIMVLQGTGVVRATPAFFYFLQDNRLRIERVLSRKKPVFNRLTKGLERNELIAREGALWWVKARPSEHERYLNMSMRDFEERVIAWKEEKNIREMTVGSDVENEMKAKDTVDTGLIDDEGPLDDSPEDEMLTYNRHQRLYVSTSVGSKPFTPEPGKSNNRILLELLQDMRFHPLPMFNPCRATSEITQTDYSRMTIPYFDVHGPVSTSVGDECLGCTRGWNHFCPVLQRKLPAVEHRARLQPPLSSLVATRVGLGLQKRVLDADKEKPNAILSERNAELFGVRETPEATEKKCVPQVSNFFLTEPSTRACDVVQFVEEAVAMKIPEPPRPSHPAALAEPTTKSMLARGALPTRGRKKRIDDTAEVSPGEIGDDGRPTFVNKCGRCRTIIQNETGCVQCRRAQLVINMSKRQPAAAANIGRSSKRESATLGHGNFLKAQTNMLGRITLKDNNFDKQSEGDKAIATAMTAMRWSPNVVLPPEKVLVPTPKPHNIRRVAHLPSGARLIRSASTEHESGQSDFEGSADDAIQEDGEDGQIELNDGDRKMETKKSDSSDEGGDTTLQVGAVVSSTDEEDKPEPRFPARERRPRRARLNAASSSGTKVDNKWEPDRQKMAEAHQEEANELQKRCLSLACSGILLAMMRRDPLGLFAEPVPSNVVGYSKIVKNPIDFGKIRSKVLKGKYNKIGAFISDARLLCTNALAFNPLGSIYSKTAKELYDVLQVMQTRATKWMSAIKKAHASSFAWRRDSTNQDGDSIRDVEDAFADSKEHHDPFRELRKTWPEAVEFLENYDWVRIQISADFMRTKENECAYYGSLAVRRAAVAAETSLSSYPDKGGIYSVVVRRSHTEDEGLRRHIDDRVSNLVSPAQLKDIPTWREEAIIRILRRVQSRRLEGRIASENGCARCDGIRIEPEAKMAMTAEAVRWGRNKKKGELDTLPRIHESRLSLSTGLASANERELVEKQKDAAEKKPGERDSVSDISVAVRGSRIHGWGLFADQPFKKGEVVAEYIGEYISNPVADAREKMYQEQRIQDYQFRVDENLVIDATMRGGNGRYINHNCNPNCIAKIVDGKPPNKHLKRVLIISQRDINAREEITYDYQFPLELDLDERIPCNCGSLLCRGFMNWDLPEKGSKNRVARTQKRGGNMRDRIRRLGRPLKK